MSRKKRKKSINKRIYILTFFCTLLITLLILGSLTSIYMKNKKAKYIKEFEEAKKTENNNDDKNLNINTKINKKPDLNTLEGLIEVSKRVNVLFLGKDGGRADTIILASYNPDTHKLDLVTIPRDTYHEVSGYDELAQRKINAVFGFGEKNGGGRGMKVQLSQLLGIPIHNFILVDYDAVSSIVDVVEGVDVEITFPMHYDDEMANPPLNIHFEPGYYRLYGYDAVKYLRWRKNNGEYGAGDIPRTQRQMDFIKSMIKRTISSFKYDDVIKTCYKHVSTDMPLKDVLLYSSTLFGFSIDDVDTYILPGESVFDGLSYYKHSEEETEELMMKIYKEEKEIDKNLDDESLEEETINVNEENGED